MNNSKLIKCAQKIAKNPNILNRLHSSNAEKQEAVKCAAAIKALYNVKMASLDLMDQAARDPNLMAVLKNQGR